MCWQISNDFNGKRLFLSGFMGTPREQLLILITTPLYLIVIGLELLLSHLRRQESYTWKDTLQNIYMMILNAVLDIVFRVIYIGIILSFFYDHRIAAAIQNPFLYWFALLIFEDFMYYWLHRVDHSCRLFWATHVTHHSSSKFNLTVGFRSSVMEPLYRFIYFIPIALFGFRPIDIAFIYAATQIWGILVHTEKVNKVITLASKFYWDEAIAAREIKMLDADTLETKVPAFAQQLAARHAPTDWKLLLQETAIMMTALGKNNTLQIEDYASIDNNCLLMLGDRDKMVGLDETINVYKKLPNAQMCVLPGTPHPFEQVNTDLLAFMIEHFLQ